MIPIPEHIEYNQENSFSIRRFTNTCNETIFHFHEDYELTFIEQGTGERFIAGKLEQFKSGDLVLIGKQLPHYYIHHNDQNTNASPSTIVLNFKDNFLGKQLNDIPEFNQLTSLFESSISGIRFSDNTSKIVGNYLKSMVKQPGLKRLIGLINILHILSEDHHYSTIGSFGYEAKLNAKDQNRINSIYSFIHHNYNKKISIECIAEIVHLSPTAFCRFFKRLTRSTFVGFLNEFRIGKACKLLSSTDLSVGDIADSCGFDNMANFNRQFKIFVKLTPLAYRKKFGSFKNKDATNN